MPSIPASMIVEVTPSVISAGGTALNLNGLILSTNTRTPIGSVLSFPSSLSVSNYYGAGSTEAAIAAIYFAGFDNSNVKPGAMLLTQYNTANVAAYIRGGNISGLTLAQLQALSGTLTLTIDGTAKTTASIALTGAASFSAAATTIQSALVTAGFTGVTCAYDSVSGAFVITSSTTGALSSMSFATGTISAGLLLTSATGAVLSQGAAAATPSAFMNSIVTLTQNWATFMTAFDPDNGSGNANKQLFASWANATASRYAYVVWDTDVTPTQSTAATTSLGYILKSTSSSGTIPIYCADYTKAAFVCGALASVDYTEHNGVITLAFKSQSGMTYDVTSETAATNLIANGYNYYGSYATANQLFQFFYPGSISGQFLWADGYVNQIWLNNAFQLALLDFLKQVKSVPYSTAGYALIRAACMDPINQAVNFGMIQAGVVLSSAQIAEVNSAAGLAIDQTISSQGWYLQILPATAQVRAARATPPMTFWYVSAGSIQSINLASVEIL